MPAEQPSKRRRVENSLASGVASAMEEEADSSGKCVTIDVAPPSKQKEKAASLKLDMPKVAHDSSKDSVTVFVSNLPYSMDEPEVKLRPLFEVCGEVVQIRPVFSNRGDFRGYCYVEFKEEKSARQALDLDRKTVEGRPMFVSPCVDKSKNPDFKVCFGEKGSFKGGCQMDGAQCLSPSYHVTSLVKEPVCQAFGLNCSEPPLGLVVDVLSVWKDDCFPTVAQGQLHLCSGHGCFSDHFTEMVCLVVLLFRSLRPGLAQGHLTGTDTYAGVCFPEP